MRPTTRVLLAALTLATGPAAQQASYGFFGTGCGASPVTFQVQGLPRLGTTFSVRVQGPVITQFGIRQSFLFTGLSNQQFGGVALPFALSSLSTLSVQYCGPLLVSPDVVTPVPFGGGSGFTDIPVPVPGNPALLGLNFYQQVMDSWLDRNTKVTTNSTSVGGIAAIGV